MIGETPADVSLLAHYRGGENGTIGVPGQQPVTELQDMAYLSLRADLRLASAVSINELRNAFMVQRVLEKWARGGSRYREFIKAFFNVTVPDLTVQVPEFLGGRRIPINMTQVAQTSSDPNEETPLGSVSAYSLTTDKSSIFTKSFTEHGYLFCMVMARTEHSYSQGIPRHFSRKSFTDFYNPTFANAPEQPVFNKELYVSGTDTDDEVFGYQEAWWEYRSAPNLVTGEFRPDYAQTLDSYHYGDDYASKPTLSVGWMAEPSSQVARTRGDFSRSVSCGLLLRHQVYSLYACILDSWSA